MVALSIHLCGVVTYCRHIFLDNGDGGPSHPLSKLWTMRFVTFQKVMVALSIHLSGVVTYCRQIFVDNGDGGP